MNLLALLALAAASPEAGPVPPGVEDFLVRCEREGLRLWSRSLCAPIAIVDPASGNFRTTQPAPGPLPALRANTAFDWQGERWVMVLTPLPGDAAEVADLLFHEAWHAHQEALGFPGNMAVAVHLEDPVARYLLRLEWAALKEALLAEGRRRERHVAQALAFRGRRLAGHPAAAEAERLQMRHEGLAAYTGAKLSGAARRRAVEELERGPARPSLARSFAYASGPAWGLLLDALRPGWRREIGDADLRDLVPVAPASPARPDDYGGTRILAEEMQAAVERRTALAAALGATADNRALRLPLARMNMDFDPNRVTAAPDGSTIYHRMTLSDAWGRIAVDGLPLRIRSDFSTAFAPWPLPDGALDIADGWEVRPRAEGGAELMRAD
jgi:hypothetical protein